MNRPSKRKYALAFCAHTAVVSMVAALVSMIIVGYVASARYCGFGHEEGGGEVILAMYYWYILVAVLTGSFLVGGILRVRAIQIVVAYSLLTILGAIAAFALVVPGGGCSAI